MAQIKEALDFAVDMHGDQTMKGTTIPYTAHILAVASTTMLYGGDDEAAIIALLHDTLEDTDAKSEHLAERFGQNIACQVETLSDAQVARGEDKGPWRQRKEHHLQTLRDEASPRALLVYTADKLVNARAILKDYRVLGEDLWSRFNGGKAGTFWYYRACIDLFRERNGNPELVDELCRTVNEVEMLAYVPRISCR